MRKTEVVVKVAIAVALIPFASAVYAEPPHKPLQKTKNSGHLRSPESLEAPPDVQDALSQLKQDELVKSVHADVVIQAGHEGRTSGATGGASNFDGHVYEEIKWTPIIADEATRTLREAGANLKHPLKVIRENAFLGTVRDSTGKVIKIRGHSQAEKYYVTTAVYIHIDSSDGGTAGESVGYPINSSGTVWKQIYLPVFPARFRREPDNYTKNEAKYYAFSFVHPTNGQIIIEFGDINNRDQVMWMYPRLRWLGKVVAYYLSKQLNKQRPADDQILLSMPGPEPGP